MIVKVKNLLRWCRRHLVLTTVITLVLVIGLLYVNVQILHLTSEPGFCKLCHPGQGFGALAEVDSWEHSGHAAAGVTCLDCHGQPGILGYLKAKLGGLVDVYYQLALTSEEKNKILENPDMDLVPSEQCLFCHSDQGNQEYRAANKLAMQIIEMRMLDSVENPEFRERKGLPDIMTDNFVGGTHFEHRFHIEAFDLECNNCHFGITHQQKTKIDLMNMCLLCHAQNKDTSAPQTAACPSCHEAQIAMQSGLGAMGVQGEFSPMFSIDIDCDGCHIGAETGSFRPTAETCLICHEQEYVEIYNTWQIETGQEIEAVKLLRVKVENELKAAEKLRRSTSQEWKLYEKALYNLRLVKNDGTSGVHNREFAQAILTSVENDFRQVLSDLENAR